MTSRPVRSRSSRPLHAKSPSVVTLALMAGTWMAGTPANAADDDWSGGPRYSYFDAGYQWADVNYAVKQEGGQHEGIKLNGSVGLKRFGRFSLHAFGEYFDGEFSGVDTPCDAGDGPTAFSGDRDSRSMAGGLGLSYAVTETTHVVGRVAYVDISKFETPTSTCGLADGDDSGYFVEGMVRGLVSSNVELEAGVRYSDLDDSGISDTDVILGITYSITDYLALRARGVVFDDDTGVELGARLYFGSFIGRDTVF